MGGFSNLNRPPHWKGAFGMCHRERGLSGVIAAQLELTACLGYSFVILKSRAHPTSASLDGVFRIHATFTWRHWHARKKILRNSRQHLRIMIRSLMLDKPKHLKY